jgi:hypothetical protein
MAEITDIDRYKEQYAHFRSMNDILYKITAIIVGLWYFAASNIANNKWVACLVFAFCAVASVCFVNVMQRFRLSFNGYINNLNKMDGDMRVSIQASCFPSTITTFQLLLWTAAIVSVAGAIYVGSRQFAA